jgi:aldose 1-epimerase
MSEVLLLEAGPWRAEVVPQRGGRMTRLAFESVEVLQPVTTWDEPGRAWPAAGLYPLVPYSNRIENGRLKVGDREIRLKIHPFAHPHAMHGPGHRRPWSVEAQRPGEIRLHLDYQADEDWPWRFDASLIYECREDALVTRLGLRNCADEPMPSGIGLHPFFRAPDGTAYDLAYRDRWPQSADDPPFPHIGEVASRMRGVASQDGILACLGSWSREAVVRRPDLTVHLAASPELPHLVLYRAQGSSFLCLEPVSHVTDAFNLHAAGIPNTGAAFLAPGEALEGVMTIRCGGADRSRLEQS